MPTVPIGQERGDDLPDRTSAENDEKVIDDFRQPCAESAWVNWESRSWTLGLAGQETKSLVGRADLGSPGRFVIKRVGARDQGSGEEYAQRLGDPAFLREIERAMAREETTVQRRLATGMARQAAGIRQSKSPLPYEGGGVTWDNEATAT